jgi:hypothetical protein
MAEISDAEYRQLTAARTLLATMAQRPDTKRATERIIKHLIPQFTTSDEQQLPIIQEVARTSKRMDKLVQDQENDKIDASLKQSFQRLSDAGYTEDGIGEIKKLMIDRRIPDPEAAAALWDKRRTPSPQVPSALAPARWNFGGSPGDDKDLELLWKDEDAWADKEAIRAWNDPNR